MLRYFPKLIVGSVFVPHERNSFWYDLQIKYLKKTVGKFRHVVCINGEIDHSVFSESDVIESGYSHHHQGLSAVLSYFRDHQSEDYLILDSDCFPVMDGWHDCLKDRMGNLKYAAPYRFENLDFFPHPCAFFIRGKHIGDSSLDFSPTSMTSITGAEIEDIGCGIPAKDCYPLIRSNFVNFHPILAAIYNHMFYHHGCGSRSLLAGEGGYYHGGVRPIDQGYFNHYLDGDFHKAQINSLIEQLECDTDGFIQSLMRVPT